MDTVPVSGSPGRSWTLCGVLSRVMAASAGLNVGVGVHTPHGVGVADAVIVGVQHGSVAPRGVGVAVGVGVQDGHGVDVAVAVAVGVLLPHVPPVSLWVPSKSADSARFVVVVPAPLKMTTLLPGGFGLPSSRSIVIVPVLHSLPRT